jgi:hypothetical protein
LTYSRSRSVSPGRYARTRGHQAGTARR